MPNSAKEALDSAMSRINSPHGVTDALPGIGAERMNWSPDLFTLYRPSLRRCAGAENTLAGLHLAARLGFRAVEFDVMLSADGMPLLIHDETLERTTDGSGRVPETPLVRLGQLDAGHWHHRAFAGERYRPCSRRSPHAANWALPPTSKSSRRLDSKWKPAQSWRA